MLQRVSFGALSDVTVVLGMRQSIAATLALITNKQVGEPLAKVLIMVQTSTLIEKDHQVYHTHTHTHTCLLFHSNRSSVILWGVHRVDHVSADWSRAFNCKCALCYGV